MFNALTTFENVKIGVESRQHTGPIGAMLRLPRTRREEHECDLRTLELLEFVGLTRAAERPRELVALRGPAAPRDRAGPRDEPGGAAAGRARRGTNPAEKLELAELIRKVNTELGITVLLIEHDMKLVMSVAQRISCSTSAR